MVQQSAQSLADLYMADETAWLDVMAEMIGSDRLSELDYAHLKEFLEDMVRRDRREVGNRLKVLLIHVLKWFYQQEKRTPSWQNTVINQQEELEFDMQSGVLRNYAEESLPAIYQKAVRGAALESGLPAEAFPAECPWTLEQLLSPEVLDQ